MNTDVTSENYNHVKHFARIYYQQALLIEDQVQRNAGGLLEVVVLGCGRGNDILTIGNYLARQGAGDRVRFWGVDDSEADLCTARALLAECPGIQSELVRDNLCAKGFGDRLRRMRGDVLLANHVLEHLWAEDAEAGWPAGQRLEVLKNRYLHPWLFAARRALSVSVPLNDQLEKTISDHQRVFTEADVEHLGESMPLRCALAVRAHRLDSSKKGGLISWVRETEGAALGASCLRIKSRSEFQGRDAGLAGDFMEPFDPRKFSEARTARKVAEILNRGAFAAEGSFPRQARQLPIKMPGTDVRLPSGFAQCAEAVQLIVDHNRRTNPNYDRSYAYFNLFRAMTTFSKYRGLSLMPHADQLQTLYSGYAYLPDWSYIVSTCIPTLLFDGQEFDVSCAVRRARNGERVNLYDTFRAQLKLDRARKSENFGIYLLSSYLVHSASEADQSVFRVFMKVAFSSKRFFDNREFRRNLAFDYEDWLLKDTRTYIDGFFHHKHWNEYYVAEDVMRNRTFVVAL